MPLDDSGVYIESRYIRYNSDLFKKRAIDINDFLPLFISLLNKSDLPSKINVMSQKMANNRTKNLENYLFIRDNRPKTLFVDRLKKHFQRYDRFYYIL